MKFGKLILTIGLLLVAGCTASSEADREPPLATQSPQTPGGALATAAPAQMEQTRETAVSPTTTPSPTTPPQESSPSSVTTSEAVAPVSVDLSKITPLPPTNTEPVEMPQPGVPGQDNILIKVQQDLAARLGKDVNDILTVSMEEVDWPDSSLGCPAGDFAYMTVITPGYRIILSVDGKEYDYHAGSRHGNFVLCIDGRPAQE